MASQFALHVLKEHQTREAAPQGPREKFSRGSAPGAEVLCAPPPHVQTSVSAERFARRRLTFTSMAAVDAALATASRSSCLASTRVPVATSR